MSPASSSDAVPNAPQGLCGDCRHARLITTRTGSTFLHCVRSETDPRYLKYPPLPVMRCAGHERPEPPPAPA